jgi:transcriptional regulator with XRE-family HTH domain
MKSLKDVMNELPADERAKVMARTRELLAEEVALGHLRKARRLTQERMAELLNIGQDSVSRLEHRSDLLISTLQSYIEAMGGALKLVVQFPDGMATLSGLGNEEPIQKPAKHSSRGKQAAPTRVKRKHLELAHSERTHR